MHGLSGQAGKLLIYVHPRPPDPGRWLPGELDRGVTGGVWLQHQGRTGAARRSEYQGQAPERPSRPIRAALYLDG